MKTATKEKFGHSEREDRKELGATYTPTRLADAVARTLLKNARIAKSGDIRILDPGCGDGSLTIALLSELPEDIRARASVTCIDCDTSALTSAEERLRAKFPKTAFTFLSVDFVQYALDAEQNEQSFDLIIANPPYVRIQALDEDVRTQIKSGYGLTGRTDLAFAFILAFTRLLSLDGQAAVITSNRVLSTDAGKPVRAALLSRTNITELWDLGDTRLFDAAVLPAVLFFENPADGKTGADSAAFTSIYEISSDREMEPVKYPDLCADLDRNLLKASPSGRIYEQRRGTLETDGTWRIGLGADLEWAAQVASNTWKNFEDVGRISVGIKTTADKVFIAKTWATPRPELLRPLVTHHVSGRYRPSGPPDREVLYPHEMHNGKRGAVTLSDFPISEAYLESHRPRLAGRSYVAEAGRNWYEIWVAHSPNDWDATKIVFRDIAEKPTFWIESAGSVVNGDCYWIRLNEEVDPDLIWLMLAIGNSSLIETFYDVVFNERLYAGRRRFMTRHVKRFPIPNPDLKASRLAAQLSRRLVEEDMSEEVRLEIEREVDLQVKAAFGF